MLSARFDRALAFAHDLHRKQRRKTSGAPYVAHLLGVSALVMEDGGSEDESIAALLHDSVEDQARGYPGGRAGLEREIAAQFGEEVARLVSCLTEVPHPEHQSIRDRRERWRAHKLAYIANIESSSLEVRRISCADSLYNVRGMTRDFARLGEGLWTRFKTRNREDQIWAYRLIADAFVRSGTGPLAQELARAVAELEAVTAS